MNSDRLDQKRVAQVSSFRFASGIIKVEREVWREKDKNCQNQVDRIGAQLVDLTIIAHKIRI